MGMEMQQNAYFWKCNKVHTLGTICVFSPFNFVEGSCKILILLWLLLTNLNSMSVGDYLNSDSVVEDQIDKIYGLGTKMRTLGTIGVISLK